MIEVRDRAIEGTMKRGGGGGARLPNDVRSEGGGGASAPRSIRTSFVVSFALALQRDHRANVGSFVFASVVLYVSALKKVHVVAVTIILVLHVGVIGHRLSPYLFFWRTIWTMRSVEMDLGRPGFKHGHELGTPPPRHSLEFLCSSTIARQARLVLLRLLLDTRKTS